MDLFETLRNRRSIRKYLDTKVEKEKIQAILEAAMSGPSACNKQPWEFYVVTDETVLENLCKATRFSGAKCPLSIVVCGNTRKALPLQLQDYWIEDTSAAIENILLAATALGLGTLWCGVYPQKTNIKNVKQILELPDHIIPLGIVKIGYADEQKEPRIQYEEKKVHYI